MKAWIIEPRDPFIARDGRPFSAGGRAKTLPFPFPSTTTGGARTRAGLDSDGVFAAAVADVKKIEVRGPLLAQLDVSGAIIEWFAPAPSDALLFEAEGKDKHAKLRQLSPRELSDGAITNLPNGLRPAYLTVVEKSKPLSSAPRYWRWSEFEEWLLNPDTLTSKPEHELACLGHSGPLFESRTHVKVLHESQTAEEGQLFQTSGLEFARRIDESSCAADRLALVIQTNADEELGMQDCIRQGLAHLGGERRFVSWREGRAVRDLFNENCPSAIQEAIVAEKRCRLVLVTPAQFKEGLLPIWLRDKAVDGFKAEVRAVANNRHQVVSGWDFERVSGDPKRKYGRPKPTRRLVPAGSVFWFDLSAANNNRQIEDWIEAVWMKCVSDDEQDRKDGFGLAVLGTWK
jgi:CRISPR-associated protein Cmr3